jgi:hypothetical protein
MDYNKEKIIATSKQDIARFIRKMYISSQVEEFITHRFSMGNYLYKNFLNKLKRL